MMSAAYILDVPCATCRQHAGQYDTLGMPNADAAYQSQDWPGFMAGALGGLVLAKTIFAAHPILWAVPVVVAGVAYAVSHLFECSSLDTNPASITACARHGFVEAMPVGAAAALVAYGLFGLIG